MKTKWSIVIGSSAWRLPGKVLWHWLLPRGTNRPVHGWDQENYRQQYCWRPWNQLLHWRKFAELRGSSHSASQLPQKSLQVWIFFQPTTNFYLLIKSCMFFKLIIVIWYDHRSPFLFSPLLACLGDGIDFCKFDYLPWFSITIRLYLYSIISSTDWW